MRGVRLSKSTGSGFHLWGSALPSKLPQAVIPRPPGGEGQAQRQHQGEDIGGHIRVGQADAQGQAGFDGAIVPGVEGRLPVISQEEEFLIPQGDFHGALFPIGGGLNTGLQIAFL